MKTKVFIDGSEGTTGLRIFERFAERDDVELLKIPSELRKDPDTIKKFINDSDITFLCTASRSFRGSTERLSEIASESLFRGAMHRDL